MLTGRFAPTPSGALHAGSLVAALASCVDARQQKGRWLLRIDDTDTPRIVVGAIERFVPDLRDHALEPDATLRQSERLEHYREATRELVSRGLVFACHCSRRELMPGTPYPGTCRANVLDEAAFDAWLAGARGSRTAETALRVRMTASDHHIVFDDRLHGQQRTTRAAVGDLVLWRRDGVPSYALSCAIDDALLVSDVVRGEDLLDATAAQVGLMETLGLTIPRYAHVPLLCDADGRKLGKQTRAKPIASHPAIDNLERAWSVLRQTTIGAHEHRDDAGRFVAIATERWDIQQLQCAPMPRHDR
ncbi:MAG: tRNA glutamyl-Q(34) synthetase GluQRS [Gammaproteobacteria bacterium]|nr:MAG: tRNA glutamyl-Q(34) synthetase GluQRS [Gammaproteobacteria bacterium]PIE37288.1 MAG: tRNA glutamyl-Q(34) synthetase GluQRS [Gammaproteobacteria bacterium]